MFSLQVMMRFFDRIFVLKLFLWMLILSLIPLGEIYLFLYLGGYFGKYLLLGVSGVTGVCGLLLGIRGFSTISSSLKKKISDGLYPSEEFASLAGLFLAALLLMLPGYCTDVLGILFFTPSLRLAVGGKLIRGMEDRLKEVNEYLKMNS